MPIDMFLRLNWLQKQFWGYILVIFQFSINRHDSKHDTKHDTLYRFDSNGNIDYTDDNTDGEVFQTNFDYVDREGAGGHHHHGSHHHGSHHNGPHHGSHQGLFVLFLIKANIKLLAIESNHWLKVKFLKRVYEIFLLCLRFLQSKSLHKKK